MTKSGREIMEIFEASGLRKLPVVKECLCLIGQGRAPRPDAQGCGRALMALKGLRICASRALPRGEM